MDYEALLKRAHDHMPESVHKRERFEIPKVRGHIQGNRTVISNFKQISDTIRRDPDHILKYILKSLATPGSMKQSGLIFGAKIPASRINEKIRKYVEEFVLCHECGAPDSKLSKEGEFTFLRCQACGAKRIVKSKL